MTSDSKVLELEAVSKTFPGGAVALSGVSLSVRKGEIVVLLGASGAGKSTLLRLANGLIEASNGVVTRDGDRLTRRNVPRIRRRTAMIFQQFQLVPRLSVERNVAIGALGRMGFMRGLIGLAPAADRRLACRLLSEVGLQEEHLNRRASDLSGGQQQRVAIARAFMSDPTLLLADEPVASLDPSLGVEIMTLLSNQARQRGAAVLCSLHQTDLARRFADRIVCLRGGEVAADLHPGELDERTLARIYGRASELTESAR